MIFTSSYFMYRHYIKKNRFVAYGIEPVAEGRWEKTIRQLPELFPGPELLKSFYEKKITGKEFAQEYEKNVLEKIDLKDYFWVRCGQTAAQNIILLSRERSAMKYSIRKSLRKIFGQKNVMVKEWSKTGPENDEEFKIDVNKRSQVLWLD